MPKYKPTGTNPAHLLRKLREHGRSDLVAEVEQNRLTAFEAAVEAGLRFRQQDPDLSSNLQKRKAFKRHPLRASKDGECWYGPSSNQPSVFKDTEEARRYWYANSARLMPSFVGSFQRPLAFWYFEVGIPYPDDAEGVAILHELGQLGVVEEAELMPAWRKIFEIACGLRGVKTIRDHLDKSPLPHTLFERWMRERRRARGCIREMEVATARAAK